MRAIATFSVRYCHLYCRQDCPAQQQLATASDGSSPVRCAKWEHYARQSKPGCLTAGIAVCLNQGSADSIIAFFRSNSDRPEPTIELPKTGWVPTSDSGGARFLCKHHKRQFIGNAPLKQCAAVAQEPEGGRRCATPSATGRLRLQGCHYTIKSMFGLPEWPGTRVLHLPPSRLRPSLTDSQAPWCAAHELVDALKCSLAILHPCCRHTLGGS